jgi:hypothetical protein
MSTTPNENTNVSETPLFDPFPEPNTMPSGWDLSGLVSEPAPASVNATEDKNQA